MIHYNGPAPSLSEGPRPEVGARQRKTDEKYAGRGRGVWRC